METQKALESLAIKQGAKDSTTIPTSIRTIQNTMNVDRHKEREQVKHPLLEKMRTGIAAYRGALALNGVIIPIVASLTMAGIYLAHPTVWFFGIDPGVKWFPLVSSTIITGIIWVLAAFCVSFFTTARTANARGYGLLASRLCQLKANFDIYDAFEALEHNKSASVHRNQAALNDARTCYKDIRTLLSQSPAGMLWVSGTGYTNAWSLMHHAEEALIESQSIDEVIRGAIHDKMAIQGSTLSRKDELLDKLLQAVVTLQPKADIYFKEHQPDKGDTELNQLTEALKRKMIQELIDKNGLKDVQNPEDPSEAKALARVALREVRSTLNDFRDKSWEGILRARNRLLESIAVTGIMTHILLAMAILTSDTTGAIAAAAAFYLVGAVTGLFGRFYRESVTGTAVDDFGFSTARLVATPLLSGLAGVGGVMLTVMLASLGDTVGKAGNITMDNIFHMDPRLFFAAAIFGLAPNLLIKGLQDEASKYDTDIQSSKAAEPDATVTR